MSIGVAEGTEIEETEGTEDTDRVRYNGHSSMRPAIPLYVQAVLVGAAIRSAGLS